MHRAPYQNAKIITFKAILILQPESKVLFFLTFKN
jgi:hypothetical protein